MSINVTGRHIAVTEALQQYVVRAQCVSDWYPANKLTHQRHVTMSFGKAVLERSVELWTAREVLVACFPNR